MVILTVILLVFLAVKGGAYLLRWYELTRADDFSRGTYVERRIRLLFAIPAFAFEYLASLAVYVIWCVEMPYRAWRRLFPARQMPARPPLPPPGPETGENHAGNPIILIHGFAMTPWCMSLYWWWLRRSGGSGGGWAGINRPVYLLDYHPMLASIDRFVPQLAALVESVCGDPDTQVDLVAHSMGGLIAARYMAENPGRTRRLVAVGTPFFGTRMWAMSTGASLPQMRPGGAFLNGLHDHSDFPGETRVTSIYSTFDEIILPYTSSHLPEDGVENIELNGLGHAALLFSPQVARKMVAALTR